jgi:hypothetical protein
MDGRMLIVVELSIEGKPQTRMVRPRKKKKDAPMKHPFKIIDLQLSFIKRGVSSPD